MDQLQRSLESIADTFCERFPVQGANPRTVGREAEFPIVTQNGEAADVRRLWPLLLENPTLEPVYGQVRSGNEQMIVGLRGDDYTYMLEVGLGTIEINTRPCQHLFEIKQIMEKSVRQLVRAAAHYGYRVLAYGVQPLTPPRLPLMSPKQRYFSLYRAMGLDWLWYTVTASDQLHISLNRAEMVEMLNLGNLMAPVLIALCANSPIVKGVRSPFCSAREGRMARIREQEYRHGMPARPFHHVLDFVETIAGTTHLIQQDEQFVSPGSQPFTEYLRTHGPDFEAFLFHDHYIWNSARLRAAYSTIEIRPACQQPWAQHMTLAALALGMIEAGEAIGAYIRQVLGSAYWEGMQRFHQQVILHGLRSPEPSPQFLYTILHLIEEGLQSRGYGEEALLDTVYSRLYRNENPAQHIRRIFRTDNLHGLLTYTSIQPA
ncbi:MAG: glutamate-cysteine ligase family protein [Chloroflexota bacterium]